MIEALTWWLAVELIGVVAFPIGFLLFRFLPDRGYGFSKVLGLLLMTYLLWLGATAHLIPNARWSIVLILVTMTIGSLGLAIRRRREIWSFVRERWVYLLLVEAVFGSAFVIALWLRSYLAGADLTSGEKELQYALINATLRADQFPVQDPWLAGHQVSYYYFGYINIAALIKLTSVPTQIAFNIALALTIALTAAAVFGLVYNLVASLGTPRHAVVFGLAGVVLLLLGGNLEGFFELLAVHTDGPDWLYRWLAIEGLDASKISGGHWYPGGEEFWWVRNRHIPNGWFFAEVPFWGFQLGDNTPQNLVLPFVLMSMGQAFNLLRCHSLFTISWIRENFLSFLLMAIMLGSLSFLNSWSFPPTLLLVFLAVLAGNWWLHSHSASSRIGGSAAFCLLLGVAAFLLFLPFYRDSREAMWPVVPSEVSYGPNPQLATQAKHLFIIWGPLLWLTTGLGIAALSWGFLKRLGARSLAVLLPGLIPLVVWSLLVLNDLGGTGFIQEIKMRNSGMLTIGILVALIGVVTLGFIRALSQSRERVGEAIVFSLATVGIGLLLILGVDLFFVKDVWGGARITTIFKLYHHTWVFLSVGAAFGMYYLLVHVRLVGVIPRLTRYLWAAVAATLLAAGLLFAPALIFSRTEAFSAPQSLNSYVFTLKRYDRPQYDAVIWLDEHVKDTPVVLQAVLGGGASWGASSYTGLPTVLGIPFHEIAYRGSPELINRRMEDVRLAYATTSVPEALAIIDRYDIEYVYVGPHERIRYGEEGLPKFRSFMDIAFENGEVTIYKMPEDRERSLAGR